jgi:hypothetical protein
MQLVNSVSLWAALSGIFFGAILVEALFMIFSP